MQSVKVLLSIGLDITDRFELKPIIHRDSEPEFGWSWRLIIKWLWFDFNIYKYTREGAE